MFCKKQTLFDTNIYDVIVSKGMRLPLHFKPGMYTKVIPRVMLRYTQKVPFSVSFDVTNRCNIRCPYCYFYAEQHPSELSDDDMLSLMREASRSHDFFHATFIGGEPTLRLPVLKEGVKMFPQSWVNTNGLNGFPPEVKASAWLVSLEGSEAIHDKIKGKGAFKKVIEAIPETSSTIIANTTLYTFNCENIEETVKSIAKTGIDGIIFSFYTQLKNSGDYLQLSDSKRTELIYRILKIRKEYPDFIFFTKKMGYYHNPHSGLNKWNHPSRCPVALYGIAYGADGKVKHPCAMGGGTLCNRCGCGMNSIFLASMKGDIRAMRFIYKML